MEFVKFTSIEAFKNTWASMQRKMPIPTIEYTKRIKLHGTNAGIRVTRGENGYVVTAQKRTSDIPYPHSDNAGFGAWVHKTKDYWAEVADGLGFADYFVIYGEWAGNGVQKTDAVSLIAKSFFIFAIEIDGFIFNETDFMENVVFSAEDKYSTILDNVFVLPDLAEDLKICFFDSASTNKLLDELNIEVEEIGRMDPYIKELFDKEGTGEGLVLAPKAFSMPRDEWAEAVFKMKSEAHRVQKSAKAASTVAEIPAGVLEFVEMFVTPQRGEQGATEIGGKDIRKMRDFLNWMHADVRKEATLEMEKMGITYDAVAKYVAKAASTWYQQACAAERI